MARSAESRGMSFRELSSNEESFDLYWEGEEDKKRRPNLFDDDDDSSFGWIDSEEVADLRKQSRRLASNDDDDDDEELSEAWGGVEYSLNPGLKTRSNSAAQSVRVHPQSSAISSNKNASKQSSSFEGTKSQTPAKRPPAPSAQRVITTSSSSVTTTSSSSSSVSLSAAAVRNQTSKVTTTQAALHSVTSSIKDVISNAPQVSVMEYKRLEAEVNRLKKDLQVAQRDKTAVPSVQETVRRIIRGEPYNLGVYKSLKDKLDLLDYAIKKHDGNAITAAVLFLRKSVKQRILHDELTTRPKAVHHLSKYLSEHYDYTQLTELYRSVGKYEEAAMLQFKQAIKSKDPGVRLTKLKYVLRHYFEGHLELAEQTTYLTEYVDLLEQQLLIEDADSRAERERKNHVMVAHPRQASLPLCSVIVTLYYCCRYHFGESESVFTSPMAIRARFKLSEKQYEWTALSSRAKLKQWKGLEQMFTVKGWLGKVKMKSAIGFTQVVELLHQHGATEQVLNTYLNLIDDLNQRLSAATKTKCHRAAIETLVAMKDRQQLEKYRSQLKGTAPEQAIISEYLKNSQLRWKN